MISARRLPSADRVYFLVFSIDSGYGISRSVTALANRLAGSHRVEIISLQRTSERPVFHVDERIVRTYLDDARPIDPDGKPQDGRVRARAAAEHRGRLKAYLDSRSSRLVPTDAVPDASALSDLLLRRTLRALQPGILISTGASFHAAVARYAPRHLVTIGQEHHSLIGRRSVPELQRVVVESARSLDCLVTLTEPDRDAYRLALSDVDTTVEAIPNAVPWPIDRFVTPQAKLVVSAGRLEPVKGFDRLVEAHEPVAHANPDWQFHIYGEGSERERLERLIAGRGLTDRVRLRGYAPRFHEILATASVFALASHHEGLPMVFLEAMSKGLPVVSFDVSPGPAQLVENGVNGWLVEDGDVPAFSTALWELVKDADLRTRMGAASHAAARRYDVDAVAARWESLFDRLVERRREG